MQNPNFLFSEYQHVRYALPFARPPISVYLILPTTTYDGAELLYQTNLTSWDVEVHGGFGASQFDFATAGSAGFLDIEINESVYANISWESESEVILARPML